MANEKTQPTKLAYEIYKKEREKIVRRMESRGYIVDVGDQHSRVEFKHLFKELSAEKEDMSARELAKELAKRQAYYATDKQAESLSKAFTILAEKGDLPASFGNFIEKWEFLYGTSRAREAWDLLGDKYHELVESGMLSEDAKNMISQIYFGS